MHTVSKALAGAALVATAFAAQAAYLDGQTVTYTHFYPDLSSPITGPIFAIVGPGAEFNHFDIYSTDVFDTSVIFSMTYDASWVGGIAFNGPSISIPTSLAALTNVTFGAGTSSNFLTGSTISFSDHTFSVDWQGVPFSNGDQVVLNLTTAVPEPETYAMLLAGLGVLGFMGKRRRAS